MIEDSPLFVDIRPHTDEEDRYIKMKDLYKQGKVDAEDLLGTGVTADEMALQYTHDPELIQHYLNGWNYQVHCMSEE
jgi:uncharacterized circularly permuted ATP-grasp superfamily protein